MHTHTHTRTHTHTHTRSSLPVHVHQFHPLDTAESSAAHHTGPVESMSEKDMKLLKKKMERQVLALKGELKDYEWRLDQESAVSLYLKEYRFRVRARCSVDSSRYFLCVAPPTAGTPQSLGGEERPRSTAFTGVLLCHQHVFVCYKVDQSFSIVSYLCV